MLNQQVESKGYRKTPSTFTNERYLNTPQRKEKIMKLKKRMCVAEKTVQRLQEKIRKITGEKGEELGSQLQSDLLAIMAEHTNSVRSTYPEGSFAR